MSPTEQTKLQSEQGALIEHSVITLNHDLEEEGEELDKDVEILNQFAK